MKKIACVLIALASYYLFAQSNSYFQINGLIKEDLFKNEAMICDLSMDLSNSEAMLLYNANELSATLPFAANFFLGAGIGSFIQGDNVGGAIGLIGELIGCSMIIGGGLHVVSIEKDEYYDDSDVKAACGWIYGGLAALLGIRIFELVRPFTYAKRYNDTLFAVLNSSYNAQVALIPAGNKAVAVASIRF